MSSPNTMPGFPDDFIARDDAGLITFIDTLRAAVKAKVAAGKKRGLSLPQVLSEVRDMVQLAEAEASGTKSVPASAFPAIAKQSIAWCREAYGPLAKTV